MKVTVIGAGSSYTPELVEGFLDRHDELPVSELWLTDIDGERLATVGSLAERMAERSGAGVSVKRSTDIEESVADASYIVTQIRVGGSQARIRDEKLGFRNGIIGQETTGVGGFACALRTVPIVLAMARAIERCAPDAFVINFTNPSGIITEALLRYGNVKVIGLCNAPINMIMEIAKAAGVSRQQVGLDYVGLNHLSWIRGVSVDGTDITEAARQGYLDHLETEEEGAAREALARFVETTGLMPNGYLRYYYATQEVFAEQNAKDKTRGEEVVEIERELIAKYADPDLTEKPAELMKRGGAFYSTAAVDVMASIQQNKGDEQIVIARNGISIPCLPAECSVEVPCRIDRDGAQPGECGDVEPEIRGLMQVVKAYEELTVNAAVERDRDAALMAMVTHPLMPGIERCREILDELLEINKEFLVGW